MGLGATVVTLLSVRASVRPRTVFQSRNPGIMRYQMPGFRD